MNFNFCKIVKLSKILAEYKNLLSLKFVSHLVILTNPFFVVHIFTKTYIYNRSPLFIFNCRGRDRLTHNYQYHEPVNYGSIRVSSQQSCPV